MRSTMKSALLHSSHYLPLSEANPFLLACVGLWKARALVQKKIVHLVQNVSHVHCDICDFQSAIHLLACIEKVIFQKTNNPKASALNLGILLKILPEITQLMLVFSLPSRAQAARCTFPTCSSNTVHGQAQD